MSPAQHVMLKPQTFIRVVVDEQMEGRRWHIYNEATLEVVALDGSDWGAEVDEGSGLCILYQGPDAEGRWASDHMHLHVFSEVASGKQYLYKDDTLVGELGVLRAGHDLVEVPIVREPHGSKIITKAAVFHLDQEGGRLWVSISDLWQKMGWNFSPGTGAQWFQNKKGRWMRLAQIFDLGPCAVRASLPYHQGTSANSPVEHDRCLSFASVHISVLLLQCITAARGSSKRFGQVADATARAGFDRILCSLLDMVKPGMAFDLRLGPKAVRLGTGLAGLAPATMRVLEDMTVSFAGLDNQAFPGEVRKELARASLEQFEGQPFTRVFCDVVLLGVSAGEGKLITRVASQLLWQVSKRIEDKMCKSSTYAGIDGVPRRLQARASDVSVVQVESSNVWDPSNSRHTERELWRYREAARESFHSPLFLSMGGPDGTKVGTDLQIQAAVVFNPVNGKAAICPPQALKHG